MEASLAFDSPHPGPTLARVLEVATVVQERGDDWPALEEWRTLLPAWFVDASAPESTREEAEAYLHKWRAMTPKERVDDELSRPWALSDWLHWFDPSGDRANRGWRIVGGAVTGENTGRIDLDVEGHPYASGSLQWLVTAAGGTPTEW